MTTDTVGSDALTAYRNALTWLRQFPIHEVESMLVAAAQVQELPGAARMTRRPTLTIEASRELVGVSRRTLYLWMDSGKIEFIRTAGGRRRIFADSLWAQKPGKDSEQ